MLDELQVGRVLPTDPINKNDIKTARLQSSVSKICFSFLKKLIGVRFVCLTPENVGILYIHISA